MTPDLVMLEQKLVTPWSTLQSAPPLDVADVRLTRGELTVMLKALRLLSAVRDASRDR
jgi:hypothetical protein